MARLTDRRRLFVGGGITLPVPIPYPASSYPGYLAVGLDPEDNRRKLYFSDGTAWTRSIFDTTIVEQIERFIDDLFLNGFTEEDLPDPTLAENIRRYAFNLTRGLPGFVWNDQWNYLTDEARAAEIAEDVAANVVRVIDESRDITVHHADPDADFPSIIQALNSLSGLSRSILPVEVAVRVICLEGHVETERCWLDNPQMPWVTIFSEDDTVLVAEATACSLVDPVRADTRPYMRFADGQGPQLRVNFLADGNSLGGSERNVGFSLRNASADIVVQDAFGPDAEFEGPAGFSSFDINFRHVDAPQFRASNNGVSGALRFNDARQFGGLLLRSNMSARGVHIKGWSSSGLRIEDGSRFAEYLNAGDFRQASSVSASDIQLGGSGGNIAALRAATQGGYNIAPNRVSPLGLVFAEASAGSENWQNFSGAAFTSGGANLSFDYYRYKRVADTCTISGRIVAGAEGGTSSSSVNINLPFAAKKESNNVANPGGAFWRASGSGPANRRPAAVAISGDGTAALFIAQDGTISGTDMTTVNGEIAFTVHYEVAS